MCEHALRADNHPPHGLWDLCCGDPQDISCCSRDIGCRGPQKKGLPCAIHLNTPTTLTNVCNSDTFQHQLFTPITHTDYPFKKGGNVTQTQHVIISCNFPLYHRQPYTTNTECLSSSFTSQWGIAFGRVTNVRKHTLWS